jgi:CelD/BcsL family acetyltransferase involved in cellulose biosynthesis
LLEANGHFAAGRYGFVYDQRYWDYQSGYDDAFRALSVGNLNLGWAAQNAISRGLREYDHLAGDQSYKQAWSTRTRRLLHLEAFNRTSPVSMLFRLIRSLKRTITGTAPEVGAKLPHLSHA